MKKGRLFLFVIFVLSAFTACNNTPSKPKKVLNISYNLPLTGDLATYGDAIRDGSLMAFTDIKKADSTFDVNYSFQDNAVSGGNANSVLQQQSLKKIDVYVSGVKPQTMSIIDKVTSKKIPHFVWVFDAKICENYANTYRTWVSYKLEPSYYMQYVNAKKPLRIAITYVQLPHTEEEFKTILVPQLDKNHQLLVEPYPYGQNDFKLIGAKLKAFKPDLIIVNGFKDNLMQMIKYFKEINLTNNTGNTICTYDFLDAAEDLPDNVKEGVRFVSPTFLFGNPDYTNWADKFKASFNRVPRYTDAYAYDMVHSLYYASKNIQDFSVPQSWNTELLKQQFKGVTGNFRYDKSGDLVTDLSIYYYQKGHIKKDL